MKSTLIKFPVTTFKKIESPKGSLYEDIVTYITILHVKDLPMEIQDWNINVRDPRLKSRVATEIKKSLHEDPDLFLYKNRGITIIVQKASFDNKNNIVELEMSDSDIHGLLDGGHTYGVIKEYLEECIENGGDINEAYIKFELLENVTDIEDVISIVQARNTSTQVKEESLAELEGKFEPIKNVLSGKDYAERIAYKEYELSDDGEKKDIDIKDIISCMSCFDVEKYPDSTNQPVRAYSQKTGVLDSFLKEGEYERQLKYVGLLPKILELRDVIYRDLPKVYNTVTGGKFGRLKGVTEVSTTRRGPQELKFIGETSNYIIPSGFIYPILSAFRYLVRILPDGEVVWKTDPIKFLEDTMGELAVRIGDSAKEFKNPNKLGKDTQTWRACYDLIKITTLERGYN